MIKKFKHYIKEILLFIVFITIFTNIISIYKSSDLNTAPLETIKAKLINNTPYISSDKKPILVHIWATWCPTCKLEASNIERISKHYEVITIGVNSGTDNEINTYLKENSLTFKVINDKDGFYAKKFNVSVYPSTFIYDKNKNLVFSEVGYTSSLGLYLRMWWASL